MELQLQLELQSAPEWCPELDFAARNLHGGGACDCEPGPTNDHLGPGCCKLKLSCTQH
eukprot:COSAG01_NODE_5424_length_4272_cov_3.836568_1_plen_57_part_10